MNAHGGSPSDIIAFSDRLFASVHPHLPRDAHRWPAWATPQLLPARERMLDRIAADILADAHRRVHASHPYASPSPTPSPAGSGAPALLFHGQSAPCS